VKSFTHVKEHVKGRAIMKSLIITKKREGAIGEMEKLLRMCVEAQIQNCVPISLMMVQL
jgi:hypothetical protein